MGLFVPGSVLTPKGQVSFPTRRAARSLLAEFVILLPIYPNHKVFVSSIINSFVPFNHEGPLPHAFAIVAEERGFLKLLWRSFCGGSLLLSGRVN